MKQYIDYISISEIIVSRVSSNSGKPRSDRYVMLNITNEKSLFGHVIQGLVVAREYESVILAPLLDGVSQFSSYFICMYK